MRTLLAVMAVCAVAWAQDDSEVAKRHFIDGSKAFSLGEFNRAVDEYRAAYNAKPDPSYLYNIAQAYRLAGDLPQALFFYRSYLHSLPDAANRDEVEDRIRSIDEQVRTAKEVASKPPNTAEPGAPLFKVDEPTPAKAEAAPVVVAPPPPPPPPLYKRWWLWTSVGVAVAVGVGIGVGVGVGARSPEIPGSSLGTAKVFY